MLQREHSAILPTFIKLPFISKILVLFILSGSFTQGLLYFHYIPTTSCMSTFFSSTTEAWLLTSTVSGLDATKPVFGVSEKARLKSVSSVSETS